MSEQPKELPAFPGAAEFYFHAALYAEYQLPMNKEVDRSGRTIKVPNRSLLNFDGTIDGFCIYCGMETPWQVDHATFGADSAGTTRSTLYCQRKVGHSYVFQMHLHGDGRVYKVGQYPSGATIQFQEIARLRPMLSSEGSKELGTGIGLAAHGVGIGSFVYLRRVIEGLVVEAQTNAVTDGQRSDSDFRDKRMSERIGMLDGYLPSFLVEHHVLYGILSKHIHELSEEECLNAFPAVRTAIELILEERAQEKEKANKLATARQSLQRLGQTMSKSADQVAPPKEV